MCLSNSFICAPYQILSNRPVNVSEVCSRALGWPENGWQEPWFINSPSEQWEVWGLWLASAVGAGLVGLSPLSYGIHIDSGQCQNWIELLNTNLTPAELEVCLVVWDAPQEESAEVWCWLWFEPFPSLEINAQKWNWALNPSRCVAYSQLALPAPWFAVLWLSQMSCNSQSPAALYHDTDFQISAFFYS